MSLYLGDKLISGIGQDRIADTLPIGAIIEWDSDLIPENWLLLNGQAVSRTVYSELFAIYGTTYGAGDGSTTFNLPDRRTRVAVGRDANDEDFAALGITGGEKEHTLTVDEMPEHEGHVTTLSGGTINGYLSTDKITSYGSSGRGWTSPSGGEAYPNNIPIGGSQPHNNLQPYIVTNFIVKAKLYTTEFIGGNIVIDNLTSDSSVNVLSARMGKELDAKKFDKGEVIDYIVEKGTEGIWTWRKWNSGMAECWGVSTVTPTSWNAWGNLYESYPYMASQNFPSGLFISTPHFNYDVVSKTATSGTESWYEVTNTKTPILIALRPNSAELNPINYHMKATGKWK